MYNKCHSSSQLLSLARSILVPPALPKNHVFDRIYADSTTPVNETTKYLYQFVLDPVLFEYLSIHSGLNIVKNEKQETKNYTQLRIHSGIGKVVHNIAMENIICTSR